MKHPPLPSRQLADTTAEDVRRDHASAITALQQMPAASAEVIQAVSLEDGVITRVAHGLGRPPRMVIVSPIYLGSSTAGRIVEDRDSIDRSKAIKLMAEGFGSTVVIDVMVL